MSELNWKRHLADYVRNPLFFNYGSTDETRPVLVDCSLGVNPLNLYAGQKVELEVERYSRYPDGYRAPALEEYVRSRFPAVKPEELIFSSGSEGALCNLGRTLGGPAVKVLGLKPCFLTALMEFASAGTRMNMLELEPPYRVEIDRLIDAVDNDTTLVYLDNPNNPTGQVTPLAEVDRLARACAEKGALLLVDEAYADFVDDANSALSLHYDNLICSRTFSKGCGLAGARVGYMLIRDPALRRHYEEIGQLFTCSPASADLAARALATLDLPAMRQGVRELKKAVLDFFAGYPQFTVAATSEATSILFLIWNRTDRHLYDELMDAGIMTEDGEFYALSTGGRNCVRLRVPPQNQLEQFKELWRKKFGPGA